MFGPMRDLSAYILSLKRLWNIKDQIREIYPCHGTCPVSIDLVPDLIAGAERIERGEIQAVCYDLPRSYFTAQK